LNALLDANHLVMGGPVMAPLLSWSLLRPAQPGCCHQTVRPVV